MSEPTDEEVNAAIDDLAERAKRSIYGSTGYDWLARMKINQQAALLKRALAAPVTPDQET